MIRGEIGSGSLLVLPLAAIIETGNHISQAPRLRFEVAEALTNLMRQSAAAQSPWAAFLNELALWNEAGLTRLADEWPRLAAAKLSMGDATIKRVAEYYAQMGHPVKLMTGDEGLRHYQPVSPPNPPRRRRR